MTHLIVLFYISIYIQVWICFHGYHYSWSNETLLMWFENDSHRVVIVYFLLWLPSLLSTSLSKQLLSIKEKTATSASATPAPILRKVLIHGERPPKLILDVKCSPFPEKLKHVRTRFVVSPAPYLSSQDNQNLSFIWIPVGSYLIMIINQASCACGRCHCSCQVAIQFTVGFYLIIGRHPTPS